jgi:hypothetical protein
MIYYIVVIGFILLILKLRSNLKNINNDYSDDQIYNLKKKNPYSKRWDKLYKGRSKLYKNEHNLVYHVENGDGYVDGEFDKREIGEWLSNPDIQLRRYSYDNCRFIPPPPFWYWLEESDEEYKQQLNEFKQKLDLEKLIEAYDCEGDKFRGTQIKHRMKEHGIQSYQVVKISKEERLDYAYTNTKYWFKLELTFKYINKETKKEESGKRDFDIEQFLYFVKTPETILGEICLDLHDDDQLCYKIYNHKYYI